MKSVLITARVPEAVKEKAESNLIQKMRGDHKNEFKHR